jgi:hypothetical protein
MAQRENVHSDSGFGTKASRMTSEKGNIFRRDFSLVVNPQINPVRGQIMRTGSGPTDYSILGENV